MSVKHIIEHKEKYFIQVEVEQSLEDAKSTAKSFKLKAKSKLLGFCKKLIY